MAQPDGPWTVRKTLEWTTAFFTRKGVDAPRLSAELLLAHVLGVPRIKLYTDYDRALADDDRSRLRDLVARAGEHEPIAYLSGRPFSTSNSKSPATSSSPPRYRNAGRKRHPNRRRQMVLDAPATRPLHRQRLHRRGGGTASRTPSSSPRVSPPRQRCDPNIGSPALAGRVTVLEGDLFALYPQSSIPSPST
jgi:hypothetical protein